MKRPRSCRANTHLWYTRKTDALLGKYRYGAQELRGGHGAILSPLLPFVCDRDYLIGVQ